jgi:hypothetical protein
MEEILSASFHSPINYSAIIVPKAGHPKHTRVIPNIKIHMSIYQSTITLVSEGIKGNELLACLAKVKKQVPDRCKR